MSRRSENLISLAGMGLRDELRSSVPRPFRFSRRVPEAKRGVGCEVIASWGWKVNGSRVASFACQSRLERPIFQRPEE